MNSKTKGNIGEAVALAEFAKLGIQVSIPYGDNSRYDLIAEFNGKLNKIQVKYCNQKVKNGSVVCPCVSSTNHTTNKRYNTYKNDVDYFVFYIAVWNKIILVPIKVIGNKKEFCARLDKPKNNQGNYNLVDNYTFEKTIQE